MGRKPAMPEDPHVVQGGVQQGCRRVDAHDDPRLLAAGEERHLRGRDDHRPGAEGEHPVEGGLQSGEFRVLVDPGQQQRRTGDRGQQQRRGRNADPHPLPDDRSDPPRPAGPLVLRHEGVDVEGHAQGKADDREVQHAGRHRRGHRLRGVPEEKHPVDEDHHRGGDRGDDQRQRHQQHFLPAAGPGPPAVKSARSRHQMAGPRAGLGRTPRSTGRGSAMCPMGKHRDKGPAAIPARSGADLHSRSIKVPKTGLEPAPPCED